MFSTVFGGELASGYLGHVYSNREQNWSRRFDVFHLTSTATPSEPPAPPAISSAAVPSNTPNASLLTNPPAPPSSTTAPATPSALMKSKGSSSDGTSPNRKVPLVDEIIKYVTLTRIHCGVCWTAGEAHHAATTLPNNCRRFPARRVLSQPQDSELSHQICKRRFVY